MCPLMRAARMETGFSSASRRAAWTRLASQQSPAMATSRMVVVWCRLNSQLPRFDSSLLLPDGRRITPFWVGISRNHATRQVRPRVSNRGRTPHFCNAKKKWEPERLSGERPRYLLTRARCAARAEKPGLPAQGTHTVNRLRAEGLDLAQPCRDPAQRLDQGRPARLSDGVARFLSCELLRQRLQPGG